MATVQSGYGTVKYFSDFLGAEIPVANAVAYGTTAGGCNYYLGPFKVTGALDSVDCGVVSVLKANGFAELCSSATADTMGVAIGTEAIFSPALNGTLILETRLENPSVLTARNIFVGFGSLNADAIAEPFTSTGTTITVVDPVYAGFCLDSQFTAATEWHMPFYGGAITGPTTGATVACGSGVLAVAGDCQILRVEIDANGTARWYINGRLMKTQESAVSTTTLLAAYVGIWSTAAVAATVDVDYLYVKCTRDWTV
jgi:hypothetical protein